MMSWGNLTEPSAAHDPAAPGTAALSRRRCYILWGVGYEQNGNSQETGERPGARATDAIIMGIASTPAIRSARTLIHLLAS